MKRLIPQFVVRFFCGRQGHKRMEFDAGAVGIDVASSTGIVGMRVWTCRCGEDQDVQIITDKVQHPRRRA